MKQKWGLKRVTQSVWVRTVERESEWSHKVRGKTEKDFKTALTVQNTHFLRLTWVARKSPTSPAKTLQAKSFENFAKCFSWLEVSLMRESQDEPWKSLCTPHDWTLHSKTSHQKLPAISWLWHATWLTHDWVAKIGQHWFLKIFSFWKTKYFPKTPKTLKNLFVFESTKIEHVKKHFIKYNYTNKYGIHWT